MKLRKHLVRDCLFALLISLIISGINYYFLIPTNYSIACPMFFMFTIFALLFTTSVGDYRENNGPRKLSAYYIAISGSAIIALEAPLVAIMRIERDAIRSGALFITLISWSIFFILLIACKPPEQVKKQ